MSQEAVKRYEEAGAQHMSVTLLPFDPKVRYGGDALHHQPLKCGSGSGVQA
jgi:hypothetical protein